MSYYGYMQNTDFNPQDIMRMLSRMLGNGENIRLTVHAMKRMYERGFNQDDVEHLLKYGRCNTVRNMAKNRLWRYEIIGTIPRFDDRLATAITIIPDEQGRIKIVTVYWNQ